MVNTVYLGLGSNLGKRNQNINKAINILEQTKNIKVIKKSSFYKTKPVGYTNQPWFINCVVEIKTNISPEKLLSLVKKIEKTVGRKKTFRWGPRKIDIDILFYGKQVVSKRNLKIPHPEIQNRKFVLVPLNEIACKFVHPVLRKTVKKMLENLYCSNLVHERDRRRSLMMV